MTAAKSTSVGGHLLDELDAAMATYRAAATRAAEAADAAAEAARDLARAQAAYDHWSRGRLT